MNYQFCEIAVFFLRVCSVLQLVTNLPLYFSSTEIQETSSSSRWISNAAIKCQTGVWLNHWSSQVVSFFYGTFCLNHSIWMDLGVFCSDKLAKLFDSFPFHNSRRKKWTSLFYHCLGEMAAQSASQQLLQCKNGNEMEIGGRFQFGTIGIRRKSRRESNWRLLWCFQWDRIFEVKIVSIA